MAHEKIVNLTGNDISIVGNYRQIVEIIPRSEIHATVRYERKIVRMVNNRIPLVKIPDDLIQIVGVPAPKPGVLYVTSSIIASTLKRPDVVSPDTAPGGVVKSGGRIIGVRGFQSWV